MTVTEIVNKMTAGEVAGWVVAILIVLMSLIEVSPIKLNPWKSCLGWLGKKLNGRIEDQLKQMQEQIDELDEHTRELWVNQTRSAILIFARECRAEVVHDSEEWSNVLNLCASYEAFIKKNNHPNGIVQSNMDYIRNLYQELSREHKI